MKQENLGLGPFSGSRIHYGIITLLVHENSQEKLL